MMTFLCLLLCIAGFLHFSMANPKQFRAVTGDEIENLPGGRLIFQTLAVCFLTVAMFPAIAGWQTEIGLVVWCGLLHVAAVLVSLLFTYQQDALAFVWRWCVPGGWLQRVLPR